MSERRQDQAIGTVLPAWVPLLAGAIVVALLWRSFCTVQQVQWNAPRLTPAFALVHGLNFYGTREAGPYLGWIYGPVAPLYLAPAAWLPNLNAAFAGAWLLNLAAFVVPLGWLAHVAAQRRDRTAWAVLFALVLAFSGDATGSGFTFLHVDFLCTGLTLAAVACLLRAGSSLKPGRWIHAAAIGLALAIWTKQSAIAAPLALAGWLWFDRRKSDGIRLLAWTIFYAVLLGAAFAVWFGSNRLAFNMVEAVIHDRFRTDWKAFFSDLLVSSGGVGTALLVILLARRVAPPSAAGAAGRALLWLAVGTFPLGALAAAKAAGGWNSVHSLTYLLAIFALLLARAATEPGGVGHRALIFLALAFPLALGCLTANVDQLRWTPATNVAEDLAYARRHPGHLYFPWNPLVTLITDGRIYPFDDALLCLERVGLEPSPASVQKELPHGALVIYPEPAQSQFALRYLAPPAKPGPP